MPLTPIKTCTLGLANVQFYFSGEWENSHCQTPLTAAYLLQERRIGYVEIHADSKSPTYILNSHIHGNPNY